MFGVFVGGSVLALDYSLSQDIGSNFKSLSQTRTIKQLQAIETRLHALLMDTTALTFNGNLDTSSSSASAVAELNKDDFVKAVVRVVETYGFHSLFSMPTVDGSAMLFLPDHVHSFSSCSFCSSWFPLFSSPDSFYTGFASCV